MRAGEFDNSKLVIFDIDDTLVNTDTRVNVVRDGQVIKQLNSHDFTHYNLQPGEEFDFGAFRDAREFFTKARPIPGMIRRLKQDIATGNKVIMLTARSDFNDRDVFLDTFRQYGIDMDRVHVYRAGNLAIKAATEEKKKIILRHLLGKQHYDKVIMYDDSVPNLNAFLSLAPDYPWSRFYAWHVDPNGQASEYHRSGITEVNAVGETESTGSYKEIEFICVNPQFPEATDPELQKQMFSKLKQIPGVIPLWQEWGDYSEGQLSLSAIYKDRAARSKILSLAKQLGVEIDLEQPVSDNYVDRAIRGEHEGQIAENFVDQNLQEDAFFDRFKEIDQVVTQTHSKLIYQLLLQMFPQGREIIDLQYNDEDGQPFAEWRRIIFEIDQWVLAGPVSVKADQVLLDPEDFRIRMQKYNQYIADKQAGKPARYFRNNDADPREIDFSKLPPVTLAKTAQGLEVVDGMHRAVLAKLVGAPLRAYVWQKGANRHPNVAKIKSLFSNIQENFADGKVQGKSRPGRVKRSGASCKGSVTDLRARAKKYGGERGRMYHWCANMKSGRKK